MDRSAVRSSDIALVGYDLKVSVLEVTFRRGGVYHYEGVPQRVFEEFVSAPSLGIYFRDHIRESYPHQKVS